MKILFIIGPSRSGTTVLSEALGKLPTVRQCNELHYYNLLLPRLKEKAEDNNLLFLLLEYIDKNNEVLNVKNSLNKYASLFLKNKKLKFGKYQGIREYFESFESRGYNLVVEQTPMNLFFMDDIYKDFKDNAKFVAMRRDVRALMASQKNRWKIAKLGSEKIPKVDLLRVRFSGHILIQLFMIRSVLRKFVSIRNRSDVLVVNYEDLVQSPSKELQTICDHCELKYDESILAVSNRGSSHIEESQALGFNSKSLLSWRTVLTGTEIWLCQKIYPQHTTGVLVEANPKCTEVIKILFTFPAYLFMSLALLSYGYGSALPALVYRALRKS